MSDKEHLIRKCNEVIGDENSSNASLQVAKYLLSSLGANGEVQVMSTTIPIHRAGIDIRVGIDGVWLNFKSSRGRSASINMNVYAQGSGIIKQAIKDWCDDRQQQAVQIQETRS